MHGRPLVHELTLCVLVLAALAYAWLFSQVSVPNERTRIYLTAALVDDGTLSVDHSLKRFGRVLDLARHEGRNYTDKAPGASFLAVPVYAAARWLHPAEVVTIQHLVNLVRTWLMLPFALAGFVLLRRLLDALAVAPATRDVVSLGYALGTPALHYGTAFYGHVIVATLLLATLTLLHAAGTFSGSNVPSRRRRVLLGLAGACAGLMGLTEYQAIVAAALCALPILLGSRRLEGLALYALGAAPFAAALLAYNAHCFGGPFELSYHHLASRELQDVHGFGLAGATYPSLAALGGLSFSLHRGLFTTAPLLGLGLIGLVRERRALSRGAWLGALAITLYFVLIVASSSVWHGGWAFGPRLLIPIMPLLAVFAALFVERAGAPLVRGLAAAAAIVGVAYNGLVQVTVSELPPSVLRPIADVARPVLEAGTPAPNLACKLGPWTLANLWPALLLGLALALFLAWRAPEASPRRRHLRALSSLAAAVLAVGGLWLQPPANTDAQRVRWQQFARGWSAQETSCHEPLPKPKPAPKPRGTKHERKP
jgi:hypothetical protein